jgi:hypothetical protein
MPCRPFALAFVIAASVSTAHAGTVQERLFDLATIEVTSELCHLDLSDAQTDRIAAIRNTMLDEGTTTSNEIATVHDQIEATMSRQVSEGLCRPAGPALRYYEEKLRTLGVP